VPPVAAPAPVSAPAPAPARAARIASPRPATADTPLPAIEPPPPPDQPAAAPPTISPGMTTDQVVAALGQPGRMVDLGSKKIYIYPTQKVIFIDGKVAPAGDADVSDGIQPGSIPRIFLYVLGLGVLFLGTAGFLFMRSCRAAAVVPPEPSTATMAAPTPSINLSHRLDELEKLKERGILTPEEFEMKKAKLGSM
jgi:hypothetical protein